MKLLIVTQKVDSEDPILGFFHRWVDEFSYRTEHVTVIAQQVGKFDLPKNVTVISLGKEKGKSRLMQILRFWKLQLQHYKQYDSVLVHMTPIWMVIGCPIWTLFRKRKFLWYEARGGGWALPLSLFCVQRVFSATYFGMPRTSNKHMVMGHGIDMNFFYRNDSKRDSNLIVAIGRITRVKHFDVILRAFAGLPKKYRLEIAGGTITEEDEQESDQLNQLINSLNIRDRVKIGWKAPKDVAPFLRQGSLLLHAASGGLDKVIVEAMSCGCPVVATSKASSNVLPTICVATEDTMTDYAFSILTLTEDERDALAENLRKRVEIHHSLPRLVKGLTEYMS